MTKTFYGWVLVLLMMTASCSKQKDASPSTGGNVDSLPHTQVSVYLTRAKKTHDFIVANLLTPYNSYRVNTTTNTGSAFEWYNASQIYADAAMVALGDSTYLPSMRKSFLWMDHLWDKADPNGGYFAFGQLDGSGSTGTKYVDDNALTGVVFLTAYDVSAGTDKQDYLTKAKACAHWILNSGLWDNTFGGGYWWNTEKQNKPTQTNGLVMQLFLRLYQVTGDTVYRDGAVAVKNWLQTALFDPSKGLFVWQYDNTGKKYTQIFTYDNAIMTEAYLLYSQVMNDASYLYRAQALGTAMNQVLWDGPHNTYIFNTSDIRINPAWCGWASQAMILLYQADKNTAWLNYAKGNIDAIHVVLNDPVSHGYYQFASLDGAARYTNMEGVDQAWMQRVQAMLSAYR